MKRWLLLVCVACGGTTGGERVTFLTAVAGPADAPGGALAFDNALGYHVVLTAAQLHVGGVYLNQAVPNVASRTDCFLSSTYVAEETHPFDVDVLDPVPHELQPSEGTTTRARSGEVWLTGGDVTATSDPTVLVAVAGTAENGRLFPFQGTITISENRLAPPNPLTPGANPPCVQRIVSPIPVDITPAQGGTLLVRVEPRAWFATVDFATLPQVAAAPPLYQFLDRAGADDADTSLYNAVRASTGVYEFTWQTEQPH